MRCLALSLLVACHTVVPLKAPTDVVKVEIVKPVPQEKRFCNYLDDPPEPPEELYLDFDDEDIVRRTTVNYREWNHMVGWAHLASGWMQQVAACLKVLQGETE